MKTKLLVASWFLIGALVAVPACDLTHSMPDIDVLCIMGAVWFGMAALMYGLEEL